ncbi:MAG: NAD(P) transhydrogenase subunit beta [uncultured Gemmatimonadetes bacterium]|uniref:NAD(P) transhydrogenase subunit beta n=1 Tax=uncultured Gemmatimonadota bacterium TaxID=203437 RepID=A0A6J4L777_9BACT|nr:MAG: NAD(P) transhydrogenase subunit beta [uncultured Gemmatimonadota bacterium]
MSTVVNLAYLLAACLFIVGLKRLGSPATARRGNQIAAVGMLIAVVATLLAGRILAPWMIVAGLALGTALGVIVARRVKMTQMPEMVAALNGLGGAASALVAWAEVTRYQAAAGEGLAGVGFARHGLGAMDAALVLSVLLSVLIGAVTFSGSAVAYGKLNGKLPGNPVSFPGMRMVTVLLAAVLLAATAYPLWALGDSAYDPGPLALGVGATAGAALLLGVLLVIPIGGADMPVVVALLNSYSALAAAANGFVLRNYALLVSGALVGASGIILSRIMCQAMNRSLLSVLVGGFGGGDAAGDARSATGLSVRTIAPDDAAVLLGYAGQVVIVPGYGLAVAQAQHVARELSELLLSRGATVRYAIHPVAGRMPGHMNVLLAEANVPYDQLFEMDEINEQLARTDVVLVIGANDVVNPAARTDPASPIYGMPILNVDHARNVVVLKRSMAAGYSGVENDLFYLPNTSMLFGDARKSLEALVAEVKLV